MDTTYTIEDISQGATWEPGTTRCWFEIRTGGPLPGHVAVEHSHVLLTGLDETRQEIVELLNNRAGDDFEQALTGVGVVLPS